MCGSWREVELCASAQCPLHPFRFGTDPFRKPMSQEQRDAAAERLRAARSQGDDDTSGTGFGLFSSEVSWTPNTTPED